jgi:hypothetical protein
MTAVVVMAGLFPTIHAFGAALEKGVDARHKAGHGDQATASAT